MSDFIMTLDSDDDSSSLVPTTSTSTSKQQLRKQQDKATTKQKQKATKKKRQQKSKKVLDVDLSDQQSSDEEAELNGVGFEGVGKMDKAFVFDGLGGGFVGDRRNNVWVNLTHTSQHFSKSFSFLLITTICRMFGSGFGRSLYSIETQRNGEFSLFK